MKRRRMSRSPQKKDRHRLRSPLSKNMRRRRSLSPNPPPRYSNEWKDLGRSSASPISIPDEDNVDLQRGMWLSQPLPKSEGRF